MNKTTINKQEVNKFSKIADEWWNPEGKFKPLHKFNPIRIEYIKSELKSHFRIANKSKPLNKLKILDIGCGGGLLSEPMSRLGAEVIGIDASERNIKTAQAHIRKSNLKINYICASPENFKTTKKFDVVLNMEIVEHVKDLDLFIKRSSFFLKKNGLMFIATINKTLKSYIFAIVGAEYVLRWLPIGTHEWDKFVKPESLIKSASKSSLKLNRLDGVTFNPLKNSWNLSTDKSVNYISLFIKN